MKTYEKSEKILPKVCKHCLSEKFLTEFALESKATDNERLTYYQTTRGLVLGGLISLEYSPFDEFISKTFSKKVD